MDPPVEHSFLRFSRGRVSLLSPPRLQPSLRHGRGQCTPVFASFASTKIRTMDLPGLFDYHLSFSSSLFFLPFFPLHSSSSTPPLSFPNNISRCLSFSSPHPTRPLFLSLSLYPPCPFSTVCHRPTYPRAQWNRKSSPGTWGMRAHDYLHRAAERADKPSLLSFSLSISPSQLPKRTTPLRGCPWRRGKEGGDRSTKSSIDARPLFRSR